MIRTKGASGSLGLRLFGAFALFAVAPTLVLVTLSDFALGNTIAAEIGKAAAGKLRVAHNVETILDDMVKQLGMRITLDPDLKALAAHTRYADLLEDARTQYAFRRYLELLDDSVRPNPLLKSVEIVFEGADYVLNSVRGVSSWDEYVDARWLAAVVKARGFDGNGSFLAPHVPDESSPEDLVLSYYFPIPPYLTDLRGAVIIQVVEREFSRMVNNSSSEAEGTITVLDSQGIVVSDVSKPRIGKPWDTEGTFSQGAQGEGLFTLSGPDGDHLVTWFRPERGPWTFVGDFSLAALTKNVGNVRVLTISISLVLIALGIALSYVLSNRFFHPVRRLIREVNERLGSEVSPEGRNELGLLSGAFDTLLKRETQLFQDLESQRRSRNQEWVDAVLRSETPAKGEPPQGLRGQTMVAGALVIDGYSTFEASFPPDQREYLRSMLLHMAEQAFLPEVPCLGTVIDPRTLALVFASDLVEGGEFADLVEEGFELLVSEARRLLETSITLSLGTRGPATSLARSWREAQVQLRQRFLHGPGQWFWAENPTVSEAPFFPLKVERQVLAALEARDRVCLEAALEDLRAVMTSRRGLGYDNALLILHQLVGGVVKHLVEARVDLSQLFGQDGDLHRALSEAETLEEALGWLSGVVQRYLSADTVPEGHVPVMIRYIRTHLRRDFGVEEVAQSAGLSYSHARKVFESAMGETIVDFTNSLRIEEAKRILLESTLPLGEVAQSVGYNNIQSFHRYFKKIVGLTPGEFRIRVGRTESAETSQIR